MTLAPRRNAVWLRAVGLAAMALGGVSAQVTNQPSASTPAAGNPIAKASISAPASHKFKAMDADHHMILLNKPGFITLLLGTSEDSQDTARAAGNALDPLRGRSDFDLIVVVDLRDSIATWVPSVVLAQMRSNLDTEAVELKPFFLKNGNRSNPRLSSHVVADFNGSICPQLGWTESSDDLRGILFGADGREIKRWDKIDDMGKLQLDVRSAIKALIEADEEKAEAAAKNQGTKLIQPPTPHRPLPPLVVPPPAN